MHNTCLKLLGSEKALFFLVNMVSRSYWLPTIKPSILLKIVPDLISGYLQIVVHPKYR